MSHIKFSIIIPCYNASKHIGKALESFRDQTLKNTFEVIVVDDCSTDDSVAIIKLYKENADYPIRIFRNMINCGPGQSRNHGIEMSSGEYLLFVDSDDYLEPSALERISTAIEHGADVVCYGFTMHMGRVKSNYCPPKYKSNEEYVAMAHDSLCCFASSKLLWKGIELPPIRNAEDIAVIPIIMSRAKKIVSLSTCLYNYIHSTSSLSNRPSEHVSRNFEASWAYTCKHIDRWHYHEAMEFYGAKTILYGATLNAIKAHEPKKRIHEIWEAFTTEYPKWYKNTYISSLTSSKRVFLKLVEHKQYSLLKLYCFMHNIYLKYS